MTPEQKTFVEQVKEFCLLNYELGGDEIVECYGDEDILEEFPSLDMEEIRDFCRGNLEQALNCRWGEDNDPQLVQWNKFKAEGFKELP